MGYEQVPNIIIGISIVIMMYFAFQDNNSYKTNNHQEYKSLIISVGVLGTFVGILIGLWDFNTLNIKASIPILLDGLKTAFITSILGMSISIFLSAIQKNSGRGQAEDEIGILNQISSRLDSLELIATNTKFLEAMPLINTKLDSMDTNLKHLSSDISSVKEEMRNNQAMLFDFLEKSLNNVNRTLEEAIDVLAEGATKEIIRALENVIQDFNKNLTQQFGDNFKQLNEAVKNMIEWQSNYKEIIGNQINNLETHLKSLAEVGEKAKLSITSIDEFSDKIQTSLASQSEALNKLTQDINKQLPDSLDELNKALTTLTNKFKKDYEFFLEQVSKLMVASNRI